MKVRLQGVRRVRITGEFIRLDALLKFASLVSTGGEAKFLIQSGEVLVNGCSCVLRGKKIRPGDVVKYGDKVIVIGADQKSPADPELRSCNGGAL